MKVITKRPDGHLKVQTDTSCRVCHITGELLPVKSRTQQQFGKDADVNNIMAKYRNHGVPPVLRGDAIYADISSMGDYQRSLNLVLAAQQQFDSLSSDVRDRFKNDPALFLQFCGDPKNADEMIKLGLRTPKASKPPINEPRSSGDAPKGEAKPS